MPESPFECRAEDGATLRGTWRLPAGPGPFPAVLCVHGLTLDRTLFEAPAAALESRGLASLRLDLRGHGGSGGRLEEQGFRGQCADVSAAFAAMAALEGADPSRLGLLGFSMGAAAAVRAARDLPVRALALWSPLLKTSLWSGLRHDAYGPPREGLRPIWDGLWVSERLFTEAMEEEPLGLAAAWPGPLLVAHGAKDRNHPQSASLELVGSRTGAARPTIAYFPPLSGHRWHPEPDRRMRDSLTAAFLAESL